MRSLRGSEVVEGTLRRHKTLGVLPFEDGRRPKPYGHCDISRRGVGTKPDGGLLLRGKVADSCDELVHPFWGRHLVDEVEVVDERSWSRLVRVHKCAGDAVVVQGRLAPAVQVDSELFEVLPELPEELDEPVDMNRSQYCRVAELADLEVRHTRTPPAAEPVRFSDLRVCQPRLELAE